MTLKQTIDKLQELLDGGVDGYTEVVLNLTSEDGEMFDLQSLVDIGEISVDGQEDNYIMLSPYNPDNPDEQDVIHLTLN